MTKLIGGEFLKYPSAGEQTKAMKKQFEEVGALFNDPLRLRSEGLRQATIRTRIKSRAVPESYARLVLTDNSNS